MGWRLCRLSFCVACVCVSVSGTVSVSVSVFVTMDLDLDWAVSCTHVDISGARPTAQQPTNQPTNKPNKQTNKMLTGRGNLGTRPAFSSQVTNRRRPLPGQ